MLEQNEFLLEYKKETAEGSEDYFLETKTFISYFFFMFSYVLVSGKRILQHLPRSLSAAARER